VEIWKTVLSNPDRRRRRKTRMTVVSYICLFCVSLTHVGFSAFSELYFRLCFVFRTAVGCHFSAALRYRGLDFLTAAMRDTPSTS